jgi:hypothetical protein
MIGSRQEKAASWVLPSKSYAMRRIPILPRRPIMDLQAIFKLTSFERVIQFCSGFGSSWIKKDLNYSSRIKGSLGVLEGHLLDPPFHNCLQKIKVGLKGY